jgi:two-component system, sensor histidine kinase PdtaS
MKLVAYSMVLAFAAAFHSAGLAQYYPEPAPVSPGRQSELLTQLKNSKSDSNKVKLLLDLSNLFFYRPLKIRANFETALHYARQAAELSATVHYSAGYYRAQLYMADIFAETSDMPSAEAILDKLPDTAKIDLLLLLNFHYRWDVFTDEGEAYDKALRFAEQARVLSVKLRLEEKEVLALEGIAAAHLYQDKLSLGESELHAVVKRMQAINYPYLQYPYFLFSLLYEQTANFDKALFYALETVKSMNATHDTVLAGDFYLNLGVIYKAVGEHQLCIDYCKKAIASYKIHWGEYSFFGPGYLINAILTRQHKNDEAYAFIQSIFKHYEPQNYLDSLEAASTMDGYYIAVKRYDLSQKLALQLLDLARQKKLATYMSYSDVGDAFIQDHKYAQAKPYLLKALNFPNGAQNINVQSMLHYWLFLCDSAAGDYISAIRHLNINKKLDDSLASISKTKAVQQIKIALETQKKEDEIKSKSQNIVLLTQRNQIQQADLHNASVIRNITFLGILILLTGGGLLYRQYRQKQRANELVTQKNEVITEKNEIITRKNEMLENLVAGKEWLLKEVHHRVKNNLHTIICLLESQAAYLENDALKAIETSKHRIYAMSLIHQKLYQSADIKEIDMSDYLNEFVRYLAASIGVPGHIRFQSDIDPLKLGVSQAIPLGLIINEAVTNSIKYAFPENRMGVIKIGLHQIAGQIELVVEDNGVGIHPDKQNTEMNSLGIDLMKGLAEDIHGNIRIETKKGTKITVTADVDPLIDLSKLVISSTEREVYL